MENTKYICKQYSENDKGNELKAVILTTCITSGETKISTWWSSCFGGTVESLILTQSNITLYAVQHNNDKSSIYRIILVWSDLPNIIVPTYKCFNSALLSL